MNIKMYINLLMLTLLFLGGAIHAGETSKLSLSDDLLKSFPQVMVTVIQKPQTFTLNADTRSSTLDRLETFAMSMYLGVKHKVRCQRDVEIKGDKNYQVDADAVKEGDKVISCTIAVKEI